MCVPAASASSKNGSPVPAATSRVRVRDGSTTVSARRAARGAVGRRPAARTRRPRPGTEPARRRGSRTVRAALSSNAVYAALAGPRRPGREAGRVRGSSRPGRRARLRRRARPPRRARGGSGGSRLAERVADAAYRLDQPRLAVRLGLPAQVADVDVERVRGRPEVVAPDTLEDQRALEHLPRVAQEQLEQVELGAGQLDLARRRGGPRACRGRASGRRTRAPSPSSSASRRRSSARTPREQLLERERLDDVVVGARVEAGDAVADGVARGQHQHRHPAAPRPQAAADDEPVDARHEHVEDDGVRRVRRERASASSPSPASATS